MSAREGVRLTGYVEDADLPAIYAAATAFVFPSLYEGFGLPPLEAMACGTPVICSNASSLPEVVAGAGLLVEPTDVAALQSAIRRLASDEVLRDTLRTQGYHQASQFSWQSTASATRAIYALL